MRPTKMKPSSPPDDNSDEDFELDEPIEVAQHTETPKAKNPEEAAKQFFEWSKTIVDTEDIVLPSKEDTKLFTETVQKVPGITDDSETNPEEFVKRIAKVMQSDQLAPNFGICSDFVLTILKLCVRNKLSLFPVKNMEEAMCVTMGKIDEATEFCEYVQLFLRKCTNPICSTSCVQAHFAFQKTLQGFAGHPIGLHPNDGHVFG